MATEWFFDQDGDRQGPVTTGQLRGLVGQGIVRRGTLLWREGMAEWVEAGRVKGLFGEESAAASDPRAAPPAPPPFVDDRREDLDGRSAATRLLGASDSSATSLLAATGVAITPLKDERIEGLLEAAKIDLGLVGMILQHRMVVVVTNERIIYVHKRIAASEFSTLDLRRVQGVASRPRYRVGFIVAAVMLVWIFFLVAGPATLGGLASGGLSLLALLPALLCLGGAALLLVFSRRKMLIIEASSSSIALPATRSMSDLLQIVDRVWTSIDQHPSRGERATA
jgi:hypothetical protein